MANQMIALQARGPQLPDMGAQLARFGNMMARQQVANRQSAAAQQTMDIEQAKETRAAQLHGPAMARADAEAGAAQADRDSKMASILKSDLGMLASGDLAAVTAWVDNASRLLPAWKEYIPSPERIAGDRNLQLTIAATVDQIVNKTIATPTASLQVGKDLKTYSATVGGLDPRVDPLTVGGAAPATAPATDAQIDEAARAILGGVGIQDGSLRGLSREDFDRATARANQMTAGGGARMQPISMTTGAQMGGQPDMAAVVQDMMSSGQISQSNLQLMREMAGPDKDAQLAQILKANNIQIVPDAQPGMRSAVFRPGQDAAPRMQLAQATNAPGTQFRVAKDPMQAPTPGSATVPLKRMYDETKAKETAKLNAARAAGPAPLTQEQENKRRNEVAAAYSKTQALINKSYSPKEGVVALANKIKNLSGDQKESVTGFSGYVPSYRPSTREADTLITNLKGVVTELGKNLAAESGAPGPMAVQEWRIVSNMVASLDLEKMTPRALDAQMDRIIEQVRISTEASQNTYAAQYGDYVTKNPEFKLKVPKGGSMISPDVDSILKSRGI